MDSGRGHFIQGDNLKDLLPKAIIEGVMPKDATLGTLKTARIFYVGEEIEVKGSHFRVKNITRHTLVLDLLALPDEIQIAKAGDIVGPVPHGSILDELSEELVKQRARELGRRQKKR